MTKHTCDPYLSDRLCIMRLYREYNEHGSLIIAVDFDDTIYDFHGKGYVYPEVIEMLHKASIWNMKIVIYTANQDYEKIEKHCKENGIKIEGINVQLLTQFENSGKLYYNILLDDRAGLKTAVYQLNEVIKLLEEDLNEN